MNEVKTVATHENSIFGNISQIHLNNLSEWWNDWTKKNFVEFTILNEMVRSKWDI